MFGVYHYSDGSPRAAPDLEKALVFMHELGHNLGLEHGGTDNINFKPNYLSLMNYRYSYDGLLSKNKRQRKIDYSRLALQPLNERVLSEAIGISDPDGHLGTWDVLTRATSPVGFNKCVSNPNNYYKIFLPDPALDWNCDGLKTPGAVAGDVNGDGVCISAGPDKVINAASLGGDDELRSDGFDKLINSGPNRVCESTATGDDVQSNSVGFAEPDLLLGFNDWPALIFDGGGILGASIPPVPVMITTVNELPADEVRQKTPPELLDENESAPLDEVTVSAQVGSAPLTVSFDGSASTATNGTIVDWKWEFGDETSGSGATSTHTYNSPGEYYASLTVTDSNGQVNLVPLLYLIEVTEPTPTPTPTPIPTPTPVPTPIPPQPGRQIVKVADGSDNFGVLDPPQVNNDRVVLFGAAYAISPNGCSVISQRLVMVQLLL